MSESEIVIEPTVDPTLPPSEPVVEPVVTPTVAPKPKEPFVKATQKAPPPPSDFETIIANFKQTGTANERALIAKLEEYIQNMKPNTQISWEDGHRHQYTLWKTLRLIIENTPADQFRQSWNIILMFFNKFGGRGEVFHGTKVFRFSEMWNRDEVELAAFQNLLNLIILTCNPATRKSSLKQVSLEKTLKQKFSEAGRQKVIAFYMA